MSNQTAPPEHDDSHDDLLVIDDLEVTFATRRGFSGRSVVRAVDKVSLTVRTGETVGIVGESGSGKSTLGRTVLGLQPFADGSVRFAGREVPQHKRPSKLHLQQVQAVFQNPLDSLNPTFTMGQTISEPLRYLKDMANEDERNQRVGELLEMVGLPAEAQHRSRGELSGGQRQRVAIARALAVDPLLIVCDEAVSALDVSTQAQIINLLADLKADRSVAYLFIGHDLTVVRNISDRVGVMYRGQLVEWGPATQVHDHPSHPYTRALIAAAPVPNPARQKLRRELRQQLAVLAAPYADKALPSDSSCAFAPRCPYATDICITQRPALRPIEADVEVACHHAEELPDIRATQ